MEFIFNKETNLTPENKKEMLRALSAGANANDIMNIFNLSKEKLIEVYEEKQNRNNNIRNSSYV